MFGIINVDKPPGMTSRDVVNRIDRLVAPETSGHAGTLDPLATGVLVVCVGQATRLVPYIQRMSKCYQGYFRLGVASDTDDMEGALQQIANAPRPTCAELAAACESQRGKISQVPPAYSAVRVRGQRAYALARRKQQVELTAREVTIERLELQQYEYPDFSLDLQCSSGTYVRAIGRDIAQLLGTGAVMTALVRTAVGQFTLQNARPLDALDASTLREWLLPGSHALAELPWLTVSDEQARRLRQGAAISIAGTDALCSALAASGQQEQEAATYDEAGRLVAVVEARGDGLWRPRKCFAPEA